jgi:hypothetical protein
MYFETLGDVKCLSRASIVSEVLDALRRET